MLCGSSSWEACGCEAGQHTCYNSVLLSAPPSSSSGAPEVLPSPLFHVAHLNETNNTYQSIANELPKGFQIDSILEIQNKFLFSQFQLRKEATKILRGSDNETVAYHVTKGSLFDICQNVSYFYD